jgi:hypothetical protein
MTTALPRRMTSLRKRNMSHVAWNLVMELHLELRFRLQLVHAPRKLAGRLERAMHSAALAIHLAAYRMRMTHHLTQAMERLSVCSMLIDQLREEQFLSPYLHLWVKRRLLQIDQELMNFDPEKIEPRIRPKGAELPRLVN